MVRLWRKNETVHESKETGKKAQKIIWKTKLVSHDTGENKKNGSQMFFFKKTLFLYWFFENFDHVL